MERPEEGCCRESRKSMPQVKGLKELRLPVRQHQKKAAVRHRPQIQFQKRFMAAGFYHRIMTDMVIFKEKPGDMLCR
jgi:hypothetical protein